MHRYSSQCRIILICNSASKVIEPVRSRCLGIRVPAPSHEDIANVLTTVAKKEQCVCPQELAMKISLQSDRNLRRALLMLEVLYGKKCTHTLTHLRLYVFMELPPLHV
jgi:replication factor C subunit 3/5